MARRLKIDHEAPDQRALELAIEVLKQGGVIAYPTETLYGLGADARNAAAVRRVFAIKRRDPGVPLPVIISDLEELGSVAEYVPEVARLLAERFWPGPLTLVVPARKDLPDVLLGHRDSVAVRVPGSRLCRELCRMFGGPVTATSANLHHGSDLRSGDEVALVLGDTVDLILDGGKVLGEKASTIVDCTGERPKILREGAIPSEVLKRKTPELEWA